jgi:hypothetical protein
MGWFKQALDNWGNAFTQLTAGRTLAIIVGVAFAVLAVGLIIASRKRLGQAKPISVAIVLSILAHIWLLTYAIGIHDPRPAGNPRGQEQPLAMAFGTFEALASPSLDAATRPPIDLPKSDQIIDRQAWEEPVPLMDLPQAIDLTSLLNERPSELEVLPLLEPDPLPPLPALEEPTERLADTAGGEREPRDASQAAVEVEEEDSARERAVTESAALGADYVQYPPPLIGPGHALPSDRSSDTGPRLAAEMVASDHSPVLPPTSQVRDDGSMPREYQLRQAPNRLQLVQTYGADAETEAAVEKGLAWLARAQSSDGSWIASLHGAGTETRALGEYRHGTGARADTGISGLALLAFLSAGHTHRAGEYRPVVAAGLNYLVRAQLPSGDLSGAKQVGSDPSVVYARMYCHSIASLALAEAYAMTRDPDLQPALLKAVQYSIRAQDVRGGGWRYRPGEAGDLSQFGWQALLLRSVERSGIGVPLEVQARMRRFLDACAAGSHGGLARYMPYEGRPTATMTAEGLACRLLINYPHSPSAQAEALHMIAQHLPGTEPDNVYYWYYATLALFQLQDENWRIWNDALKARLLSTQLPGTHPQAGSWDPDTLWGGYGGRVYSTALSCLCLEVYYRYLPMYQHAHLARDEDGRMNR